MAIKKSIAKTGVCYACGKKLLNEVEDSLCKECIESGKVGFFIVPSKADPNKARCIPVEVF